MRSSTRCALTWCAPCTCGTSRAPAARRLAPLTSCGKCVRTDQMEKKKRFNWAPRAAAAPTAEATDDASTKRPRRDSNWSPGHQRMGMRTSGMRTSETPETSRKRPADDVPADAAGASRATKRGRPAGWTPGCGLTYEEYRAKQSSQQSEPSQKDAATHLRSLTIDIDLLFTMVAGVCTGTTT